MKRKRMLLLAGLATVLTVALATTGVAFAATGLAATPNGIGLGLGGTIRDGGMRLVDILADLTGLSTTEIMTERAAGASIADIAEASGVSADDVLAEALAVRTAMLEQLVADGTITQDQADLMYEQMADRLSERIATTEVGRPSWAGQGSGTAAGIGRGQGQGAGAGQGRAGAGLRDGSCLAQ